MPDETQPLTPRASGLDEILAEYVAAEEQGRPPDRQGLLSRYPQFAADLREFFANRDAMQRLAAPLRDAPEQGAAEGQRTGHPLLKIRYFGDYELLDEIAAGGMGVVYKARQVSLNRIVAVKMILKGTLAAEEDVKRFRAEAEAAANLQHPAIVAIHEVGLHEGQHYFSMDYVDGQSLAQLPREQPFTARQAAEYVRDAAEAVHYAHQQGTLHRDLKPSNILIDSQGRVRITDFGLAKKITGDSDLTHTGQILGTPSYMPPEQALGKRSLIGAASDIYSLGAVLYELLTGRPPFRGESPAETLRQVESLDPISPRLLSPAAPRDLETICLKCLEKEPHKRYGTAQLLADDLGRYLRGEPIRARPIRAWQRAAKWVRRHPTATGLAVMSMVAVLALVGLMVGQSYNARLKTLNDQLASAKSGLESRNEQLISANKSLATTKAGLETSNQQLSAVNGQLEGARASLESRNKELGATSGKLEKALGDVKAERASARRYLYAARMALVQRAEQEKNAGRVVQLLRSVIPETSAEEDLRDFEWHHLWRKYHGEELRLRGHAGPVIAVAFSPDGKWIASGSDEGTIKLWDAINGKEYRNLLFPATNMTAIRFAPDGKLVAAAPVGAIYSWDLPVGNAVPMSYDVWKQLAGTSANTKTSRNGLTWTTTDSNGTRTVTGLTRSGNAFLKSTITVKDAWKSEPTMSCELSTGVSGVACSHSGSLIAAAGLDLVLRIWEVESHAEIGTLHVEHEIESVAFSPDESRIAAGSADGTVTVWNIPGRVVRTLNEGGSSPATCVSFGAGGRLLSAVCGTVRVWDVVTGQQTGNYGLGAGSGDLPYARRADYRRIVLSPRSDWVAGATPDGLISATTGLPVRELSAGPGCGYSFSGDESLLAEAWITGVRVWTTVDGREVHSFKLPRYASCVAFSPDNKLFAAGSGTQFLLQSGSLNIWETTTERGVLTGGGVPCGVWGLAFSPDGRRLAVALGNYSDKGANVGRVWVLDTSTWKLVYDLRGHSRCVWSVSFSPSGKRLASAAGQWALPNNAEPGEVIIWDMETGQELLTLTDEGSGMYGVAFSPDGRWLATASKAGAVKLLDGTPLAETPAYEPLPETQ